MWGVSIKRELVLRERHTNVQKLSTDNLKSIDSAGRWTKMPVLTTKLRQQPLRFKGGSSLMTQVKLDSNISYFSFLWGYSRANSKKTPWLVYLRNICVTAAAPSHFLNLVSTTKVASPPPFLTVKSCSLLPHQDFGVEDQSFKKQAFLGWLLSERVLWSPPSPRSILALCCFSLCSNSRLPSLRLRRCLEVIHRLAHSAVGTPFGSPAGNLWQGDRKEQ